MTRKSLLLTLVALMSAMFMFAYDFKSGDLCYNITGAGTVEVTRDTINDYEGLTNVVIPGTVTHNGKTYSVTSIGDLALSGCQTLTSVSISDGIVSIGEWAFGECPNLISVTIPNSVTTIGGSAFSGAMITSLTLPNNLTTIGEAAFMFCLGLTSVDIPSSVTYIGEEAFTGCLNIMSLTVPTGVTNIGEDAFQLVSNVIYSGTATGAPWGARSMNGYVEGTFVYADATKTSLLACNRMAKGAITIPNSVTSIGDNAFYYCDSITSITIPNSVTSIGEWVFRECYSLTSITIPNDVTSIKRGTFDYCAGLTSVTIPNSVTSIGACAFRGCTGLTSITIPNNVTSIGNEAFSRCFGLTSVTILEGVTSIGESAFASCTSLTSVTIPEGVTSIGSYAFSGCTSLTSVTIPNSVTTIGAGAFSGCTGLTSVIIPNSVTSIGDYAFRGCTHATITVPNSVTEMGWYAFDEVLNIIYHGTDEYAPWGARHWNAYVEGNLVYADSTKTILIGCSRDATGAITIPNSVTIIGYKAFSGCTGLTSVTIPNSVTTIFDYAFEGCTGLISVTIPNSVTAIGNYAFYGCTGLTSVIIPNSVTSIGDDAFREVLNIIYYGTAEGAPWGAKSMNMYADGLFTYSDSTKTTLVACSNSATGTIIIPTSVTSIEDSAFYNCQGITSISIPRDVANMGNYVFYGCNNLTSVVWNAKNCTGGWYGNVSPFCMDESGHTNITSFTFGDEVENIPHSLCENMYKLTSITIPKSVTNIENFAFALCNSLTSIVVEAGNPIYDSRNNCNAIIETASNTLLSGCQNTIIPTGITTIYHYAFYRCHLTSITIPASVTTIGAYAFALCSWLESVTCQAVEPPTVYDYDYHPFYGVNISDIPLYVQAESVSNYATAEVWRDFKKIAAIGSNPSTSISTLTAAESDQPTTHKVLRGGQVLILRGDKTYTLTGEEVR